MLHAATCGAALQAAAGGIEAALAELDMEHYDSSDDELVDREALLADPDAPASAAVIARALGGRSAGIIIDDPYMQVGVAVASKCQRAPCCIEVAARGLMPVVTNCLALELQFFLCNNTRSWAQ